MPFSTISPDPQKEDAVFHNQGAGAWRSPTKQDNFKEILSFHQSLSGYALTPLHSLKDVAKVTGVKQVLLKDETSRLGLPAFKVLGASWAIRQAIAKKADLSLPITIENLSKAAKQHSLMLLAATDGNHGRAVARIARLIGVERTTIFVPHDLDEPTKDFIRTEGASVVVVDGDYDEAVRTADELAKASGGMLIQDNGFEGYEEIPNWIVDGYSTLLSEIEDQMSGHTPDFIIVPVGVGSIAQAVVTWAKQPGRTSKVLVVEPTSAPCLYRSLKAHEIVSVTTGRTIMSGMNCPTVSTTAWPTLSKGVDWSIVLNDWQVHNSVKYLHSQSIMAGPCGAATLAAHGAYSKAYRERLGMNADSTILLICTEGAREYEVPSLSQNIGQYN